MKPRLLGCNAAEILEKALASYRQSPEFREDFELAQKSFSVGDLNAVTSRLQERSADRAKQRANAIKHCARSSPSLRLTSDTFI